MRRSRWMSATRGREGPATTVPASGAWALVATNARERHRPGSPERVSSLFRCRAGKLELSLARGAMGDGRMFARKLAVSALLASACACGTAAASTSDRATPASGATAGLLHVSAFASRSLVSSPRLSPDGQYLSVRTDSPSGEMHGLAIYRLSDMKVVSMLRLPIYEV